MEVCDGADYLDPSARQEDLGFLPGVSPLYSLWLGMLEPVFPFFH